MTKQRWWNVRDLRQIRLGVFMGKYHRDAGYFRTYHRILNKPDAEWTLYEKGLVAGMNSTPLTEMEHKELG